jgi:hypothetical protein
MIPACARPCALPHSPQAVADAVRTYEAMYIIFAMIPACARPCALPHSPQAVADAALARAALEAAAAWHAAEMGVVRAWACTRGGACA